MEVYINFGTEYINFNAEKYLRIIPFDFRLSSTHFYYLVLNKETSQVVTLLLILCRNNQKHVEKRHYPLK